MAPSDHVPDSTDWHATSLAGFAAVEAALRCQVCKDLFKTPMITSCSHTFCSLCIRRALANDGKCPFCRSSEQEIKLRSNWALEETVEAFAKARQPALDLARNGLASRSRSPKRAADDGLAVDGLAVPEAKRLRTSARLKSRGEEGCASSHAPQALLQATEDEEGRANGGEGAFAQGFDDDKNDLSYDPNENVTECPLCSRRMKAWKVFNHLEKCPGPSGDQDSANPSEPSSTGPSQAQRRQQTRYERLPMLNYSMLKDTALRKKMSELGIASSGPRPIVEKRHKEWTTLWNSNCDSANPKTKSQLLQDLDVWERTLGSRAPVAGRAAQNAALVKDKDFDGKAWAAKHTTSFQDLIANARKSRLEASQRGKKTQEGDETTDPMADEMAHTREGPALYQATPSPSSESTPAPAAANASATSRESTRGPPQSREWPGVPLLNDAHLHAHAYDTAEDETKKRTECPLAPQQT